MSSFLVSSSHFLVYSPWIFPPALSWLKHLITQTPKSKIAAWKSQGILKILSGKPGKVREKHTYQVWTTMTIDEYDHFLFFGCWILTWQTFSSYTSRFDCTGSGNFFISIVNWEIIFEQKWTITIFWMVFNLFIDGKSKKTSEWTCHAHFLI